MENLQETKPERIGKGPLSLNKGTELAPFLIIIAAALISFISYPNLPETVITHWNFQGEADGWSSRLFHAIFFPALMAAIYILMNVMPGFDPKKERYQQFASIYILMRNLILASLLVIFMAATGANLGYAINIGAITASTVGLLMMVLGNFFGKLRRNWFAGIRNPWTLSSENVWNRTHRFGGKLFVIWGFLIIISPWLPVKSAFIVILSGALAVVLIVTIYSYFIFKQEKTIQNKNKNILEE